MCFYIPVFKVENSVIVDFVAWQLNFLLSAYMYVVIFRSITSDHVNIKNVYCILV